jgi:hypothetical protein
MTEFVTVGAPVAVAVAIACLAGVALRRLMRAGGIQ